MSNTIFITLLAILTLPLLLAMKPGLQVTFEERLMNYPNSSLHNLTIYPVSTGQADPIPVSNYDIPNNNCSISWSIEGYFTPIESDYEGKGYAQTITIYSLDGTDNSTTRTLNSDFLKNVQMEGWGLTNQGDYIGSWDDKFWGPLTPNVPVRGYPLVAGLTSQTDKTIIPYGEILTIPTLPSPWNTKTFVVVDAGSTIAGREVHIYTGVGTTAEKEKDKITGIENILCMPKKAQIQECKTGVLLPNSTQLKCDPDSTITISNISIGDPVYDQFDSYIINATSRHGITDKMMAKSIIMQESHFKEFSVSSDVPCGVPSGWTDYESRSFGLMQLTPACKWINDGRPNLTTDSRSPNWATSWFNPEYNIDQGVKSLSDDLLRMKSKFSECSNEQYMLMALGAYNSGDDAIYGCSSWNDRADMYITSVTEHHRTLSQIANIVHAD
ncbi:MAG: transglycosylase SLT domain-containing protein [Thermoproteota archaeon]|nr:transglycosylase SLT domain-containing protein [Thermoproteota archaeon]